MEPSWKETNLSNPAPADASEHSWRQTNLSNPITAAVSKAAAHSRPVPQQSLRAAGEPATAAAGAPPRRTFHGRAALLMAVCCLLPFGLVVLNLDNAWIAVLLLALIAPVMGLADLAALFFAVAALRAPHDEKWKAWLAIALALPVVLIGAGAGYALFQVFVVGVRINP